MQTSADLYSPIGLGTTEADPALDPCWLWRCCRHRCNRRPSPSHKALDRTAPERQGSAACQCAKLSTSWAKCWRGEATASGKEKPRSQSISSFAGVSRGLRQSALVNIAFRHTSASGYARISLIGISGNADEMCGRYCTFLPFEALGASAALAAKTAEKAAG